MQTSLMDICMQSFTTAPRFTPLFTNTCVSYVSTEHDIFEKYCAGEIKQRAPVKPSKTTRAKRTIAILMVDVETSLVR